MKLTARESIEIQLTRLLELLKAGELSDAATALGHLRRSVRKALDEAKAPT